MNELLYLLERWRIIYHKIEEIPEEVYTDLEELHRDTCVMLVDKGVYKREDLFWTEKCLDHAEKMAKYIKENIEYD